MFSRRLQIGFALGSMFVLLAAIVAVNARLSWRPVAVDFAPASPMGSTHFPIAWRGGVLWMLNSLNGVTSAPLWKEARNWNRKPLRVMQAARPDSGLAAICSGSDLLARVNNGVIDGKIDLRTPGDQLVRTLEERPSRQPNDHTTPGPVDLLGFSPDGKRLAASSHLYNYSEAQANAPGFCRLGLVVFDTQSGQQIARQNAVEGSFADLAWSSDSRQLAGITADGWVFVLDGRSGKLKRRFRAHALFGACITWSPDGKTVVTASNPRLQFSPTHLEWSFKSGGDLTRSGGESPDTIAVDEGKSKLVIAENSNGDTTWNGKTERLLKRFDARTGTQIGRAIPLETGAVDMAFSPDGGQIAVGQHEFALLLNARTLQTERRLDVPPSPTSPSVPSPVCVAWSNDGATLATSTSRGLMLWRVR